LEGKRSIPCQVERQDSRLAVTWLVRGLRKGEKRTYKIEFVSQPAAAVRHTVRRIGNDLELLLDNQLFVRYDVTTGPNKPYFHPVYGPDQRLIVRGFPVAPRPGETNDHPHHRGLWFTHGNVNGEDFWSEQPGVTQHAGYSNISSGPVYCGFEAETNWINRAGETIARDSRRFRAYVLNNQRILDVEITIRPTGKPLVFGDTKEGTLGMRLADSMRLRGGDGHIANSQGVRDKDTWGKRADWVDYYGSVDGQTVGVAILDHPKSFRHPTYWHVRDYGLFAANPFGIHDFESGQPATAGNHTVPLGGSITFRYRLIFHRGTTESARIADLYADYADPPTVTVR